MTPESYQALMQACQLLPHAGVPHCLGKLLCTLLFVKGWSDSYLTQSTILQAQGQNPEQIDTTLLQRGFPLMQATSRFSACLSEHPECSAVAITDALRQLERDNPGLMNALQPLNFGYLKGLYDANHADPANLSRVVQAMAGVSFENPVPSLASGVEFSAAIAAVCHHSDANARAAAPLIASILAPQANEVALDLACGQGHLLWALAAELASNQPDARLHLLGMEDDAQQWRMAKLLFSLSGFDYATLLQHSALRATCFPSHSPDQAIHVGSADMVVLALPDKNSPWPHELARQVGSDFFPVRPPFDNRIALIWLALVALKQDSGRLAVLVPLKVLASHEGHALCKHLVEVDLLDAVLTLPDCKGHVLLVVRQHKPHRHIAFIHAKNHASIRQAWQARLIGQGHGNLVCLANATVAQNGYTLDFSRYAAPVNMFNAKP